MLLICDAKTKHPIMLPITFSVLRGLTGLLSVQYAMSLNIKRASYAFQQQRSTFQFPFPFFFFLSPTLASSLFLGSDAPICSYLISYSLQ